MKKIGAQLKEKREELGLSIADISDKTRLTSKHIKALEEGDITFFQDDLSYLRFFVKSYCDAVGIDFEDMKEELRNSISDFTMTSMTNAKLTHEEINRNINNSEKLTKVKSADIANIKIKKRRNFQKPDISLVSLIAIIGVVAMVILFAFILWIKNDAGKNDIDPGEIPVAEKQTENNENNEINNEPIEEKKEMEIVKDDSTHFTIMNVEEGEDLTFETYFGGSISGYSITVDGETLDSQIYQNLTTASTTVKAKKGMKIEIYVGYFLQTTMKINDKTVKIDDTINNSGLSYQFEFTVGDNDESAQ